MSALTYLVAWRPISARIHGLENAAAAHARFLASHSGSPYGADKALQKHCEDICTSIEHFSGSFGDLLPDAANIAIDRFLADGGKQIRQNRDGDALLVRTIIVKLVAFESELTYCLESPMERVRSASELAFMHLQQLIVVDEEYRAKWRKAFSVRETHCEKLGAVHLLWHGIWAFKADANSGGRTDLVYQEPLQVDAAPVAIGMIFTEWKRGGWKSGAGICRRKASSRVLLRRRSGRCRIDKPPILSRSDEKTDCASGGRQLISFVSIFDPRPAGIAVKCSKSGRRASQTFTAAVLWVA